MPEAPSILVPPVFGKGLLFGDVEQPKQDIFTENVAQQYALGTLLVYNDGRKYRYAKNGGTALVKNLMNSAEDQDAKLVAETQTTSGANVDVGDVEIVVDITTGISLAENELVGGTVFVESSTAIGDDYQIIASKLDASDDTLLRLRLRNPIRTDWSATTVITIMKSPWMEVDVFPTTAVNRAVGVNKIAVTASYFCWLQTGGPCALVVDNGDTTVKGEPGGAPGTTGAAGEIGVVANDGTDQVWGTIMYGIAGDGVGLVWLTLD
jgi:hypothetical protein